MSEELKTAQRSSRSTPLRSVPAFRRSSKRVMPSDKSSARRVQLPPTTALRVAVKSKADFISKLGTVEEEADESGFWLEMLRDIVQLRRLNLDARVLTELARLLDEANQLVAITVASRKTARANDR